MGVFGRFFGRKNEASTEEVAAENSTAASEEKEAGTAEAESPVAEAVEIPKQQSAEVAADSETGEGART
ncbi:gliding motility protein [Streptomyces sp. APSN-46.1]|uniref:gliding motility protein n=1 Tax=Streptomyces sp. APSN-46.1 TaxID=2929049 RepID=UPI001FB36919|nr:gliding motility protein [Streptomyces sp. APSN-46.1]MCJ1681082.1 gliding motility protein [Streptomyces sp. APSN-46.1]